MRLCYVCGDLFQGLFDVILGVVSAETKKNGDDGTSKSRQHWGLRSVAFHLQNCGRRPRVGQRLGLSFGIHCMVMVTRSFVETQFLQEK